MKESILCLLGCLGVLACSVARGQLIVAHRGASFDAPENTLSAFQLAWEQNADAIESDFHLSVDGQIACLHDGDTERLAGRKLVVSQSTLHDLQQLDVGTWKAPRYADQRMPSMSAIVALVPPDKLFYIEIKCGPELLPVLKHSLEDSQLTANQTVIISFKPEVIAAAKQAMPDRRAYWLADFKQDPDTKRWSPSADELLRTAAEIKADGVDLNANQEVVTAELISRCHQAKLSVHVWTVDDPQIARHFAALGIDSITTNRPAMLREHLAKLSPASALPSAAAPP